MELYLSNLKLWNFRKFGSNNDLFYGDELRSPDLSINFNEGINAIIGENDSGKTAVVDAIKIILNTRTPEWIRLTKEDFYENTHELRIECVFSDLSTDEAANFIEFLGFDNNDEQFLKLQLHGIKKDGDVLYYDIKAGVDTVGILLPAHLKEKLRTVYLKPLRDAKRDLIPKKNSRLSQILEAHEVFDGKGDAHELVEKFSTLENAIEQYFISDNEGKKPKNDIEEILEGFFKYKQEVNFTITNKDLRGVLEILKIALDDEKLGLGSHNLLFMAAELLSLKGNNTDGIRLGLIEELEAHLHPQAQMRVIQTLQEEADKNKVQFILTTHSPNIGSKLKLNSIYISEGKNVFSLKEGETELEKADYEFLERFLDVTKANLFFSNGIILVEGWAEELLIPVLAEKIGINLTKKGVSIVNVGNTAFLRYAKIFKRVNNPQMETPVSIITDLDIKPDVFNSLPNKKTKKTEKDYTVKNKINDKKNKYNGGPVQTFVSPRWTLEYCIALSPLAPLLFQAIKKSIEDMREDEGTEYSRGTINEDYNDYFLNKSKEKENVAFEIYYELILKKSVSKSIVAQNLSTILLNDNEVKFESMEEEYSPLKYLFDAIRYAANEPRNDNPE